jgi:DNA-binding NarL/FixJ family response regulator
MQKIKIVIVDDHQMFLEGLVSILADQENIQILFTENDAGKALNRLTNNNLPDIIITDISMPKMNGIEFIKILVLSMFKNLPNLSDIEGYLLKETDKKVLIETIKDIVLHNKKVIPIQEEKSKSFEFKNTILSEREKQIIKLIAQEFTSEEIAEKLFLSKQTIETHRKNIFLKLQVKNIAGLVRKSISLGIID